MHRAGGGSRPDDTEDCDREPEATENAAGAAVHSPLPAANELVSGTMEDAAVETEDGAAKPLFKTLLEKRFAALKADQDNAEAARGNANTDEADHAALNIECGGERHRERHIARLVNETYDVVPTAEGKDDFFELDDLRGEDAYGDDGSDGSKNDRRSHISGYDRAAEKSFFRCVEPRSRRLASEGSVSEPTKYQYPDDFVVSFDGTTVGTILREVGQGAMGTVYQMRLTDGSICAAKAVRPDVSPEERNQREKDLAAEVTFGFTMGRSPFVMSVFRMVAALPDTETTALGLLLLCAFVDGGDLEEAMSTKEAVRREQPDYKGDLWGKNSTIWPVASVTLQVFMAFEHCHERGVFHQDFKPANLMLCLDGVAKLCDFSLASFTRRVSFDPWTKSEPEGGQLCSQYTGGTVTYFSPEQIWLKGQLGTQINSEQAYHELKQTCPLTPAVCDLYAASLVVLEMHSRTGPPKNDPKNDAARIEAVHRCAARKPRETVVGLSPEETEQWLVDDLGFAKLKGRVASNNVTSEIIMKMPSLSLKEAKQELKDIPGPVVNGLHSLAKKALVTLSTSADFMHENIQNLLEKMFSPNVAERPVTAACAFKQLMAPELHQYLPEGTNARAIEHSDDEVASTLGGLAKLMVLHGDIPSALTTVAEWMGMSFNAAACSHAQSAFCDLLK